jgi:hypothetical protein
MMMTACDLSAIAKPWDIQSKVTQMFEGLSCAAFLITTQHLRTCGFQQSTLKTEEDVRGIAISMAYHCCNAIFSCKLWIASEADLSYYSIY